MNSTLAITIRLPWAAAIRSCVKTVENRGRPIATKHIGQRVAIHAGSVWDWAGDDPRVCDWWGQEYGSSPRNANPVRHYLRMILAVATIAGCHEAQTHGPRDNCCTPRWGDRLYRGGPCYHIELDGIVALPEPIGPVRGQLHVPWVLDEDVTVQIAAQLQGLS